jgi:P4 family phage/plasmid primase-like protien
MSLDEAAVLAWVDAGCSVIPIQADGTKRPAGSWKAAQSVRATRDVAREYASRYTGVGVVCGAVSGSVEMLELEGRAITSGYGQRLREACRDHGIEPLLDTLLAGCVVLSPSGGFHIWYRVDGPARGNTKLARRPGTGQPIEVLIETRGEGGFAVVPPSAGAVHPTGKAWTQHAGSPATIPTITIEDRDTLHAVAHLLDEMPAEPDPIPASPVRDAGTGGRRPGDDYNDRATWDEILTPHGWTKARRLGAGYAWRRPGKTDPGISATTGQREDKDRLYVFTTSTEFEAEKPYDKFSAYALLEYGGNFSDASRALRKAGYGDPDKPRDQAADLRGLIADHSSGSSDTDGNLAKVLTMPPPKAAADQWLATDDSNALGLVEAYGERIRYCTDKGRWLAWDGTRWEWQASTGGAAREYAKTWARDLPDGEKHESAWKKRSLSSAGTTAMLVQAATDPRLTVTMNDLDAHPWELNTPAGIVDLRTGELCPSDPAKLHTRVTGCAPDLDADPTTWARFLTDTFNDETLIAYLRRLVGYSAVGVVGPHVLPFCHGSGGNGKGVFLEVLVKALGDYATTAPSGFLMASAHVSHETEIARLAGARMVLCSEVNEDDRFDEAKVKQLTGGDTLTARFMRQDHFTFAATHQLWLMGNHKPAVRSGGRSFWRRLRLVPFEHEVPEDKVVDDLQGILFRDHGPPSSRGSSPGPPNMPRAASASPNPSRPRPPTTPTTRTPWAGSSRSAAASAAANTSRSRSASSAPRTSAGACPRVNSPSPPRPSGRPSPAASASSPSAPNSARLYVGLPSTATKTRHPTTSPPTTRHPAISTTGHKIGATDDPDRIRGVTHASPPRPHHRRSQPCAPAG